LIFSNRTNNLKPIVIKTERPDGWMIEESWLNGRKHGTEKWFDKQHRLRKEIDYKKGAIDGFWQEFSENGREVLKERYKYGNLTGITRLDTKTNITTYMYWSGHTGISSPECYRLYFPDGSLQREEPEKNGVWHGLIREWNEIGELIEETVEVYGKIISRKKWKNGILIYEFQKPEKKKLTRFSTKAARLEARYKDIDPDNLPEPWPAIKKKFRIICSALDEKHEVTDWKASLLPDVRIGLEGESWPVLDDRPAVPLFQLRLSDIKNPPKSIIDLGWICVFTSAIHTPDVSSCIRTYPKTANLIEIKGPMPKASQLSFFRVADHPYAYPGSLDGYPMEHEDAIGDHDCLIWTKVGGWPRWLQEGETLENEEEFIIQLDCSGMPLTDWYPGSYNLETVLITRNLNDGSFKIYHQFS
jgi:antitoxin component YwqK of YwqJK toxin-antitoxin module